MSKSNYPRNGKAGKGRVKREQPRKDNRSKRVNFDNVRESKLDSDIRRDVKVIPPMTSGRSNDLSWYTRNPEMLKGSANITFYNVTGAPIEYVDLSKISGTPSGMGTSIPGVMSMLWSPYIGGVDNVAVNQAANDIYSFVVHANSRNTSYDSPDLMMLILAGASVFSMVAMGIRAYGTMRKYNGVNSYLPNALLKSMGFQPDDLRSNYSHMYFDINRLISRTKTIWIPKDLPFIERWFWMNSHTYMDSSSTKGQYYLFTPRTYLTVNETGSSSGTSLDYVTWYDDTVSRYPGKTWSVFVSIVDQMIDNLLRMQYRGVIFGDILKAYTPDKLFAISNIGEDYQVDPTFDMEVLTQIENLVCFPNIPLSITQDPNTVTIQTTWPTVSSPTIGKVMPKKNLVNFHQAEAPTEAQLVIATRLSAFGSTPIYDSTGATLINYAPKYAGTEIISNLMFFANAYATSNGAIAVAEVTQDIRNSNVTTQGNLETWLWATFDWAPALYTDYKPWGVPTYVFSDYCNHTFLTQDVMQRLHTMAVYSEFGVPTYM